PSSAMQEDHVSMGWSAARKLRRSVDALSRVLAIELLTAARGIQLRAPLQPAAATAAVIAALGAHTNVAPGPDRFLAPDIDGAWQAVVQRSVVTAAEAVTGPLH
ncbi:MAG: histidine ammonia-lyase, partial [Humibacillus sp.]|nr:histidine ammonia-lyase [Humibacillus sp.]